MLKGLEQARIAERFFKEFDVVQLAGIIRDGDIEGLALAGSDQCWNRSG